MSSGRKPQGPDWSRSDFAYAGPTQEERNQLKQQQAERAQTTTGGPPSVSSGTSTPRPSSIKDAATRKPPGKLFNRKGSLEIEPGAPFTTWELAHTPGLQQQPAKASGGAQQGRSPIDAVNTLSATGGTPKRTSIRRRVLDTLSRPICHRPKNGKGPHGSLGQTSQTRPASK